MSGIAWPDPVEMERLPANHRRTVAATLRTVRKRLEELVEHGEIVAPAGELEHLALLEGATGMEAGPRHIDSLLAALSVAADDLEPRRLRGYGTLDAEQQATLHRLAQGLRRLFESLRTDATAAPAQGSAEGAGDPWTPRPIGVIHSPWTSREEAPRQPPENGAEGTVELFPELAPALADLEGFERIWLLCLLDRAGPWTLRATPPLDDRPHGLFATRSPRRPNPIGLSCVRLLQVDGPTLRVAGLDMLDGTPLLDIKPYIPQVDAWPGARAGWLDDFLEGDR